jgi:hypothetical protein
MINYLSLLSAANTWFQHYSLCAMSLFMHCIVKSLITHYSTPFRMIARQKVRGGGDVAGRDKTSFDGRTVMLLAYSHGFERVVI